MSWCRLTCDEERSAIKIEGYARNDDAREALSKLRGASDFYAPHHHFTFLISRETLIKSLSDFTLEFLCTARNNLTRIASYLRKVMTKLCIKILVKSDSAI